MAVVSDFAAVFMELGGGCAGTLSAQCGLLSHLIVVIGVECAALCIAVLHDARANVPGAELDGLK